MSLVITDESYQKRTLYKEIAALKRAISEKQTAHSSKKSKSKNRNRVRKAKHSKRSFTNPKLVQSSGVSNSRAPPGDVEDDASTSQIEHQYFLSSDGKSVINANIFRAELIRNKETMEDSRVIEKLKKRLERFKCKHTMCDRVLINGGKYSVVRNGYLLSPLAYYKDAEERIFWNNNWYKLAKGGHYTLEGHSKKNFKEDCRYFIETGFCQKGSRCKYTHDKEKIQICPYFLSGSCTNSNCLLNHTPNHHNTPLCHFNLEKRCTNSQCKYSHLVPEQYGDPGYEIGICRPFAVGHWCPRGRNCPFLHVWNCPDYEEELVCPRGDMCPLNHVFTLRMQDRISSKSNKYIRDQTLVQEEEEDPNPSSSKVCINSYTVDPSILFATDTSGNYQHYIDQERVNDEQVEPAPSTQFLIEFSSDEEEHFSESEDEEVEVKKEKDYDGNFVDLLS